MAAIFACLEKIFAGVDAPDVADAHGAISQHLEQAAKAGVPLADVLAQVATSATDKAKVSVHDATMLAVQASTAQSQCGGDPYQQLLSQLCDCVGQAARAQTAAHAAHAAHAAQTSAESAACDAPRGRTVGSAAAALRKLDESLHRASAEDWCVLAASRLGTADLVRKL